MKRWTLHILLCLLLSAVTTVGVAWGLAYWVEFDQSGVSTVRYTPSFPYDQHIFIIIRHVAFGADRATVMHQPRSEIGKHVADLDRAFASDSMLPEMIITRLRQSTSEKVRLFLMGDEREVVPNMITEDLRGWPMRSMAVFWNGGLTYHPNDTIYSGTYLVSSQFPAWGVGLSPYQPDRPGTLDLGAQRALPLLPIFPGFLINTLFYTAIWFGLFFGISATQRTIRYKRGRCVKCAYDLQGNPDTGCPECGWNRKQ